MILSSLRHLSSVQKRRDERKNKDKGLQKINLLEILNGLRRKDAHTHTGRQIVFFKNGDSDIGIQYFTISTIWE